MLPMVRTRNNNLRLKISGQALIEHDLRLHSHPSAKEMAANLKGAEVALN
jgi:hypothetical protein